MYYLRTKAAAQAIQFTVDKTKLKKVKFLALVLLSTDVLFYLVSTDASRLLPFSQGGGFWWKLIPFVLKASNDQEMFSILKYLWLSTH